MPQPSCASKPSPNPRHCWIDRESFQLARALSNSAGGWKRCGRRVCLRARRCAAAAPACQGTRAVHDETARNLLAAFAFHRMLRERLKRRAS